MKIFRKQPNDVLDYDVDFTDWLDPDDSISLVDVTAPTGIQIDQTQVFGSRVKLWISGGSDGESYQFAPVITTAQGREKEVDFLMIVTEQ